MCNKGKKFPNRYSTKKDVRLLLKNLAKEEHHIDGDHINDSSTNKIKLTHEEHTIIHGKYFEFLRERNMLKEYYVWVVGKYLVNSSILKGL